MEMALFISPLSLYVQTGYATVRRSPKTELTRYRLVVVSFPVAWHTGTGPIAPSLGIIALRCKGGDWQIAKNAFPPA